MSSKGGVSMPKIPKVKTPKMMNPKAPTIKSTGLAGYLKQSKMV